VIVPLHVATGAAVGALTRSPVAAAALGPVLHAAGDRMPHQDIASDQWEIGSGLVLVSVLAAVRGPLDATVMGALAASAPDAEHLVPLPRPGGRKLFPSHRIPGWHRAGGAPAWLQAFVAGVLFGAILATAPGRRAR
jgi:hypothetical protein